MEECLFCPIIKGEVPAERVYEDDSVVAFLDIFPRAPGHVVLIPRFHAPTLVTLPATEVPGLFLALQKIAAGTEKALGAPGLTIGINQGRVSGQEVDHLHIHLLPRFEHDGGKAIQSVVDNPPQESLSKIAEKIKANI